MEVGAATCGVALLAAGLGEYRESVVLRDGLLALVAVPVSVCALGRKTTGRLVEPWRSSTSSAPSDRWAFWADSLAVRLRDTAVRSH
jgi:hypothetical protein